MEFRHAKNGSLNIPLPSLINGGPPPPSAIAGVSTTMGRFDDSRSPPNRQNTSHVPCKFFRTGACQAGNSCPFSHDLASTTDNICKYFAKGNCKFGPKCANIHVLPDGRRVNYTKSMTGNHLNVGSRVNIDHFHAHNPSSTLTNSFVRSNGLPPPYGQQFASFREESLHIRRQASVDISVTDTDASYASIPGSSGDEDMSRYGLGLSPAANKVVNFLDVPLPSSYDSSSVSWMPHNNNMMASSVPAKLGLEKSLENLRARDGLSSETLKNLHHSVYGEESRERLATHAASQPIQLAEEYLGKRAFNLHRPLKRGPITTSTYKAVDKDWEANFTFEEDYLPETLKDLMTPQEKARRGSRNADEEGRFLSSTCTTATSNSDAISKFGSPSNASPSRWGPLFQRQQQKEEEDHARVSAFGHVGSPLRNSTLNPGTSPKVGPIMRPNGVCDTSQNTSICCNSTSILSQQLQRTHISQAESSNGELALLAFHPKSNFLAPKPNILDERRASASLIAATQKSLVDDRRASASNISPGTTRRHETPMDGENGEFVFSMQANEIADKRWKRNSGVGAIYGRSTQSPRLGVIGATAKIDMGDIKSNVTGLQGMFSRV